MKDYMKIKLTEIQIKKLLSEVALADPVNTDKITSPYGQRDLDGDGITKMHSGIDIRAKSGTQIKSPAGGIVVDAKFKSGACGGTLAIKHSNGFKTRYCHVKQFNVKEKEFVTSGQVLALTGGNARDKGHGNSRHAHLHYEVYDENGKLQDPANYITGKYSKSKVVDAENIERPEGVVVMRGDGLYGGQNDKVREIQTLLVSANYVLPRFGIDGKFGPETEAAVTAFQTDHMTKQTGQVDKAMEDKLKDTTTSYVNLKPERNDLMQVQKLSKEGTFDNFSPVVKDAINKAAIKHNVPVNVLATIANIESGGNPGAVNKSSQASGLFQVLPRYWKTYGLAANTVFNPSENADKSAAKLKEKIITLNSFLGRAPTPSELYVSHNQGTSGFKVIKLACDSFGSIGGVLSLRKAAVQLGKSESVGDHIYKNMAGNKGATPCKFLDTWNKIYAKKQIKMENLA